MSWNHPVNQPIEEAIASGELSVPENLLGKKIDLDAYFATPESIRMAYSVLKNSNFTPLEVDLLKQRNQLKKEIEKEHSPDKISEFQLLLAAVEARLNLKLPPS